MMLKKIIPNSFKKIYRSVRSTIQLQRSIDNIKHKTVEDVTDNDLLKLIEAWGNTGWSADINYLREIMIRVNSTKGLVLECGTGISTLILGLFGNGVNIYSLESDLFWKNKIDKTLKKYQISNVHTIHSPIISYNDFHWYNNKNIRNLKEISLVICDGPPSKTKGGRYGLMPVMFECFANRACILLDDTVRQDEMDIIKKWEEDFNIIRNVEHKSPFSIISI